MKVKINGTGIYLPPRIEKAKDIAKLINKSTSWVENKSGVYERRISDIDVREKRSDETLTEHKQIVEKKEPEVNKLEPRKKDEPNTKPKRSLTRSNTRPNTRSNKRNIYRKKNNNSKTNRKISIQNKKIGEKDIQNVSQKMRQIRNTKTDEIKKELKKQGVKVSGKSDRLLKDIYLYSKVCNINIQHEV